MLTDSTQASDTSPQSLRARNDELIIPFSTGSQYADWEWRNCDRCRKRFDELTGRFRCGIQEAITMASLCDGEISEEIAQRMGLPEGIVYTWDCHERELDTDDPAVRR